MALADIWRTIAVHGLAGGAGVALWFATRTDDVAQPGKEPVAPAAVRERSVESQRRGRNLAEDAVGSHGEKTGLSVWAPLTSRRMAEEALAGREAKIAKRQSDAVALVAAAGKFSKDDRLLEKIREFLFAGGDDEDAAAMMLALVLRDEEEALEEIGRREALLDKFTELGVMTGLQAATLEIWAAREGLPRQLRERALYDLAQRFGPASDLEGFERVWQEQAGDPELRGHFMDLFVGEWICGDGPEAVEIIFKKWPDDLRVAFLEELDGFRDGARPIWTDTLAKAMREAPWEAVPEEVATMILGQIKKADDPWDYPSEMSNASAPLARGLEGDEARRLIHRKIDGLLDNGPDLREQLADGRIDVEGLARRVASRLPGSQHYPSEFAEVLFEESATIDPVGALKYADGKIAPDRLKSLGSEAFRRVEDDDWRLDRTLAIAALLPSSKAEGDEGEGSGGVDQAGDFVVWHSLAREQAGEALGALPVKHPLRISIEDGLRKEGSR